MGLFSFGKKKESKEPQGSHTLPDFVRGIQHAVNTATAMYDKNSEAFLDRHFEKDGDPKTITVKIPNSKMVLVVPTIATAHPPDMILEEMEVRMAVRIDRAECKSADHEKAHDMTRSSFQVSLSSEPKDDKSSNVIDLVMKFRRGDPPEGVARIIEEFTRSITPRPKDGPDQDRTPPPEGPTAAPSGPAAPSAPSSGSATTSEPVSPSGGESSPSPSSGT